MKRKKESVIQWHQQPQIVTFYSHGCFLIFFFVYCFFILIFLSLLFIAVLGIDEYAIGSQITLCINFQAV